MTSRELLDKAVVWLENAASCVEKTDDERSCELLVRYIRMEQEYRALAETAADIEHEDESLGTDVYVVRLQKTEIVAVFSTLGKAQSWVLNCSDYTIEKFLIDKIYTAGHGVFQELTIPTHEPTGDGWNKWPDVPAPNFTDVLVQLSNGKRIVAYFMKSNSCDWWCYYGKFPHSETVEAWCKLPSHTHIQTLPELPKEVSE